MFFGLSGGMVGYLLSETEKIDEISGEPMVDVLELRNPKSLSLDTRKIIDLITIQKNINPVGSQKFKIQKYSSNVDLLEKYRTCCDIDTATSNIAKKLQKIGSEIKRNTNVYFANFKAGIDDRFEIDLGKIDYLNNEINNYDRDHIISKLSSWLEDKLITSEEYTELIYLANQPLQFKTYENLKYLIDEKKFIQWTNDDLIKGEIKLIGDKILTLEEAIQHKSVVKVSVWAKIQGNRFTEITNVFILIYIDNKGKEHVLNLDLNHLIGSYMKDIILYSIKKHKRSMKVAKRIWQLSTYLDYKDMLTKLSPLFTSDIGLLNQIVADIEVIIQMLESLPNPPYSDIISEMDGFKPRLGVFLNKDVKLDEKLMFLLIDEIIYLLINSIVANEKTPETLEEADEGLLIQNLKYLQDYFIEIVEKYSEAYLDEQDINPDDLIKYVYEYNNSLLLN